jgi:hypothetical protein
MTEGLRSIISLSPDSLRSVAPAEIVGRRPKFEWVDPRSLFVEEDYPRAPGDPGDSPDGQYAG